MMWPKNMQLSQKNTLNLLFEPYYKSSIERDKMSAKIINLNCMSLYDAMRWPRCSAHGKNNFCVDISFIPPDISPRWDEM
jgi:hypothetical protein